MKKTFAFLALAVLGYASTASAQTPIVIKFSHVVAADTAKGKAAEYFKKLAEERTRGAVRVEVYHNSILYKDKEELEMLQLGSVPLPVLSKRIDAFIANGGKGPYPEVE